MNKSINRRDWFKSTLALTAGFAITPALVNSLMAGPVSQAEREFYKSARLSVSLPV